MKKIDVSTIGKLSSYLRKHKLRMCIIRIPNGEWRVEIESSHSNDFGYAKTLIRAVKNAIAEYENSDAQLR